jgi:hypothetical protein
MNPELIKKLGPCGAAGILLGVLAVWWIEPATGQGSALLILVGVAIAYVVCGIAAFVRKQTASDADESDSKPG